MDCEITQCRTPEDSNFHCTELFNCTYGNGDRGSTVVAVLHIGMSPVRSQLVSVDFSLT